MSVEILEHIMDMKESLFGVQCAQYSMRRALDEIRGFIQQLVKNAEIDSKILSHITEILKQFNIILEKKPMDKQINKIKKDLDKGEKDTKKLLKMDKVQDRKVEKCEKMSKKKKK